MRNRSVIALIIVLLAGSLSGCGTLKALFRRSVIRDYPYYATAKKWFAYVDNKAKEWRPDAVFYGIGDTEINMNGEGDGWDYYYDSPGANKQAVVRLEGGFIALKEENRTVLTSVRDWGLDSPEALSQANAAGGGKAFLEREPKAKVYISLVTEMPNTRKKQTVWFLKYQGTESLLYVLVDAQTGKVLWKNFVKYS